MQQIVAAFLEGMYYAGKLPSRREIAAIATYLTRCQLKGMIRVVVEQVVSREMDTLHARIKAAEKKA